VLAATPYGLTRKNITALWRNGHSQVTAHWLEIIPSQRCNGAGKEARDAGSELRRQTISAW